MSKSFVYLVKVSPQENNNRYYRMVQNGDVFEIEMGRIGANPVKSKRPMSLWEITLSRKLSEGYEDRTDYCQIEEVKKENFKGKEYALIKDRDVRRFVKDIQKYADRTLKESYTVSFRDVSRAMISEAQDVIFDMVSHQDDLYAVQMKMQHLFVVIPRKMKNVSEMLPATPEQVPEMIQREQDILDVMEAKVSQNEKECHNTADDDQTVLDVLGLDIRKCSEKENEQIKKHLGKESLGKFKRAFRVHNQKTDRRFDKYMENHALNDSDIHYFYHGSRNMNYYGLITEGPRLNPKAPITGKMFGYGIYFANRAKKSINYTDLSGAYWSNGASKQAFLAVYKVAYGNPLDVDVWSRDMTSYTADRISPHDAVFAHKGTSLINDEIIVYDEAQVTLQYIIELKPEE